MSLSKKILLKNNLRPTTQRIAIINYILKKHKVHITAAKLITYLKIKTSTYRLATIYNNLK